MDPLGFLDFNADFTEPQIVNTYDELPLWSAMFGLLLLEHVPLLQPSAALDVGCGTGFPLVEVAERLGPQCAVHGIDPWREALGRAAEKIANRRLANVSLHEGSAVRMPFGDGTFDLIVSNLGVNNLEDHAAALKECRRVAAEGSVFALTTNLQGHMREFYSVFAAVLQRSGDAADLERLQVHVAHRATVAKLSALLDVSGFRTRKVIEREAVMRFADGTALLNHHFIKLAFLSDWKQVVPARQRETFASLRDALDDLARREGDLRLTIPMAYIEAVGA